VIAYAVFGIFLGVARLFAHPVIAAAIYGGTHVLVQLLFTPLLVIDLLAWRVVAAMFDRERLVTGRPG